jgi:hypothetical protein
MERGHDIKFSIDDLAAKTDPEPWDGINPDLFVKSHVLIDRRDPCISRYLFALSPVLFNISS